MWDNKIIKDVAQIVGGGTPKTDNSEYWDGEINWFTPSEIGKKYIFESERKITNKGLKKSSAKLLPENSILLSTRATIGETSIIKKESATNQGFQSLVVKKEYNSEFIYYLINLLKNEMIKRSSGSTFLEISKKEVEKIPIKVPTLDEQNKIADFLTTIDKKIELLEKTKKCIEKFSFKLINDIIGQKYKTPYDNSIWKKISLESIGKSYSGLSGKNKDDFIDGTSKFIPYRSIFDDFILDDSKFDSVNVNKSENQNLVSKGDIFFTISSETPNEVGMASVLLKDINDCYLNSFSFGFRLNSLEEYNPLFLVYYFRSLKFKKELFKLAQGSTRFNISKKELLKEEIEVPTKYEQDYYVSLINNMFIKAEKENKKLIFLQSFKRGILQKMFV